MLMFSGDLENGLLFFVVFFLRLYSCWACASELMLLFGRSVERDGAPHVSDASLTVSTDKFFMW